MEKKVKHRASTESKRIIMMRILKDLSPIGGVRIIYPFRTGKVTLEADRLFKALKYEKK